ncbi:VOC family protein [Streptomyces iconiensis]|uniref:VOC family protein n=1 Tax=Streptomyces iconiensis TaxID=1384038 RepID=A0ABT6ZWC6_9ACTN|nr:VOC family protein [Streptomyces iconiensis]MDJ1133373.1 VOC family protein [Streptomyces iconiensis]
MPLDWKLVIDCEDPHQLAHFWERALGYTAEDHSAHIERLHSMGAITEGLIVTDELHGGRKAWRHAAAIRHPHDAVDPDTGTGLGRRLLFMTVPEQKEGKNRLHIDVHAGPDARDTEVKRLERLGARVLRVVVEPGSHHVTMADPEGNEFDVR